MSLSFLRKLVLCLAAATFALSRWQPIYWEDVWLHLGVGSYILSHHVIPRVDIFSWTVHGARWINTEWLYQVIVTLIVQGFGLFGLMAFKNTLVLLALFFVDKRLRFWDASVLERVFFVGLVFLAGWPFWIERADLSSLALFSALFWEIDGSASGRVWSSSQWLRWIILFALWANLHGQFTFGLFVLLLYGLSQWRTSRRLSQSFFLLWTLCLAATFLNPNGWQLHASFLRFIKSPVNNILEWMPPEGLGFLFFDGALALAVISFTLRRRAASDGFFSTAILAAFGFFALRHQRFVHFFLVGAFPYAARNWLQSRPRAWVARREASYEKAALAGLSLFLFWTSAVSAQSMRGGIDVINSGYAKGVCDFIERQKIAGPFYNDYKFGAYWVYRFQGNPPVFQDGRHEVVKGYDRLIDEGLEARQKPGTWNHFLDQWGVKAAVVRPPLSWPANKPILDQFFPRTVWTLAYQDDQCLLFLRRPRI